jgi:hypothetical protein
MNKLVRFFSTVLLVTLALGLLVSSSAYATPENGKLRLMVQFAPGQRASWKAPLANGAEFHLHLAISIPCRQHPGGVRRPQPQSSCLHRRRCPHTDWRRISNAQTTRCSDSTYGIDIMQARVWDVDQMAL